MKKLLYAAIVAFLFVGGLAAGVVHKGMQKQNGGGGETIAGDPNAVPTEAGGLSLADLGAQPTPAEGTAMETLNLTESVPGETPTAIAAITPESGSDTMADTGRSFGGGSNPDPVKSSSGSSGSSGSSASSADWSEPPPVASSGKSKGKTGSSASAEPDWGSGSISSNTEYGADAGTVIDDSSVPLEPVATPRKGKGKGSSAVAAAPTPEPVADSGDPFNEMPTVSDSGSDPFADSAPVQPPTPDPFAASVPTPAPMVAMAMPSGGGDLVFGAASKKPALVKVAQKQNGSSSVVSIELAGSARYKIIQIPKRRQVWVDFEGVEVPGGGSSVGGSAAHVREISAKFFANESGSAPTARVIIQVDDAVMTTNEKGKEAILVTPGGGTGEGSRLQLTIGAKSQSF